MSKRHSQLIDDRVEPVGIIAGGVPKSGGDPAGLDEVGSIRDRGKYAFRTQVDKQRRFRRSGFGFFRQEWGDGGAELGSQVEDFVVILVEQFDKVEYLTPGKREADELGVLLTASLHRHRPDLEYLGHRLFIHGRQMYRLFYFQKKMN